MKYYILNILFLILSCDTVNSFTFRNNSPRKVFRSPRMMNDKADFSVHPSEIINSFKGEMIGKEWSYSEFMNKIDTNKVDAASFIGDKDYMVAIDKDHATNILSENLHSVKLLPHTHDLVIDALTKHHINTDIIQIPPSLLESISTGGQQILTLGFYFIIFRLALTYLFGFGMNQNQNPMDMISGRLNPKAGGEVVDTDVVKTRFEDVAGCDEAKFELMEVVDFLKNPKKYSDAGAKIPKGVLLEGNPGTGKTLLARAVAGEAGVPFISASGSEFIEMYVGVGASRVRSLFEKARKNSPCVIFIDEIDAVGRQRGAGVAGGNDEREQTLNQILTNMDGFETDTGIVVLAATNRVDILDGALTRPGRFDRKVTVPLPDKEGRKSIAKVHLKNKKIDDTIDIDELASLTSGFSGADIANLANEAAIYSVRKNQTMIDRDCLMEAYEKITIGIQSNIQETDSEIINLVSYHETGHALMAALFPNFFDVRKVTINSNKGGAGGYTLFTPKDRFNKYATKKFMLANLIIALGGRAAEVFLYNKRNSNNKLDNLIFEGISDLDVTTGASNDLQQAKRIARNYVTQFGFSENIGLYDDFGNSELPFLGKEMASSQKISEKTRYDVDREVSRLIDYAYNTALKLIELHKEQFIEITNVLVKERVISGDNIKEILDKHSAI